MGHRMLLNIHDSSKLLLPGNPTAQKWTDYQLFYGAETRFLGGLIRPYLEAHLFSFAHDEARQRAAATAQELAALARDEADARQRRAVELAGVVQAATAQDRQAMIQMLAIQSDATSLNAGSRPAWALRNLAVVSLPFTSQMVRTPPGAPIRRQSSTSCTATSSTTCRPRSRS